VAPDLIKSENDMFPVTTDNIMSLLLNGGWWHLYCRLWSGWWHRHRNSFRPNRHTASIMSRLLDEQILTT